MDNINLQNIPIRREPKTRTRMFPTPALSAVDFSAIEQRIVAQPAAEWPQCPNCRQSATGVYLGRPGCCRCGWPKRPGRTTF